MEIRDRILYLVAGIVVMTGLALVVLSGHRGARIATSSAIGNGSEAPVAAGSQAADFKLEKLDGTTVSLESLRGKVVFLNVWATWCEPCRVEMPSLEKLHREFGPQGLSIVALSVDDPGEDEHVRQFAKELGLTFEILLDPARATSTSYQVTGFPETFVIGREGTIRKKVIGAADWSSEGNRALIRELLGASAVTASR